jgi:outer membrane immunogenic protein
MSAYRRSFEIFVRETNVMRRKQQRHGGENSGRFQLGKLSGRSAAIALASLLGATSAAIAADLPLPAPPLAAISPVYDWSAFYVGGNLGAGWSGISDSNFSDTLGSTFTAPTNTQFVGGAQVGINYQFRSGIVVGAEAMFDWSTVSHNNPVTATDPTGTVGANIGVVDARWMSTATGKLGYAWDRVLLYGKGGAAWVATTSPSISVAGVPASFSSGGGTTNATWTAGFGLEWAFSGNWSVRAEYDYIALPSQSLTVTPATPTFGGDTISFNNRNLSIFTAALNYKFAGWW